MILYRVTKPLVPKVVLTSKQKLRSGYGPNATTQPLFWSQLEVTRLIIIFDSII